MVGRGRFCTPDASLIPCLRTSLQQKQKTPEPQLQRRGQAPPSSPLHAQAPLPCFSYHWVPHYTTWLPSASTLPPKPYLPGPLGHTVNQVRVGQSLRGPPTSSPMETGLGEIQRDPAGSESWGEGETWGGGDPGGGAVNKTDSGLFFQNCY